jgi:hypothetical protein
LVPSLIDVAAVAVATQSLLNHDWAVADREDLLRLDSDKLLVLEQREQDDELLRLLPVNDPKREVPTHPVPISNKAKAIEAFNETETIRRGCVDAGEVGRTRWCFEMVLKIPSRKQSTGLIHGYYG